MAVVTGAAGVLGRAISAALLADGLRVALVDLNSDRVEQARADLGSAERTLAVPERRGEHVGRAVVRTPSSVRHRPPLLHDDVYCII